MHKNVTFLVSSCDKYEDAWHPFFELLHIYGGDFRYPIVLNTETKQYASTHFDVRVINTPGQKTWSERMLNVLEQIETEYVFWVLEDYFLKAPFDHVRFEKVLSYMDENDDVGYVSIAPRPLDTKQQIDQIDQLKTVEDSFWVREYEKFVIGVVPSVWKRSFFIDILRAHEDIWQFEAYSGIRAKYTGVKVVRYLTHIPTIYEYDFQIWNDIQPWTGIGLTRGQWLPGNVEFFKRHGIDVNFDNLGILNISSIDDIRKLNRKSLKSLWKSLKRRIKSYKDREKSLK